mmetsp:Transcript_25119/g.52914  ORF Transcript_25119/g.52914 Transcript_25119/m.52914 type:complete len:257 (+) Transcript_25119:2567-3337(+)
MSLHHRRKEGIEVICLGRQTEPPISLSIPIVIKPIQLLRNIHQLFYRRRHFQFLSVLLEIRIFMRIEHVLTPSHGNVIGIQRQGPHFPIKRNGAPTRLINIHEIDVLVIQLDILRQTLQAAIHRRKPRSLHDISIVNALPRRLVLALAHVVQQRLAHEILSPLNVLKADIGSRAFLILVDAGDPEGGFLEGEEGGGDAVVFAAFVGEVGGAVEGAVEGAVGGIGGVAARVDDVGGALVGGLGEGGGWEEGEGDGGH